ncbi:MAG TPA: hypothetical protein VIT92_07740, partial [Burkholderiaceae bacterium]
MLIRHIRPLLLVLMLCASVLAAAAPVHSLRFTQLNTRNDAPFETAWSIAQDSTGFMWFGGQDGLRRYDGNHVRRFRANNA